jgi:Fic family protein
MGQIMIHKNTINSLIWPNFSWNNAELLQPLSEARKAQAEALSIQSVIQDKDKKRITPNYKTPLTENMLFKWHSDLFLNGREGLKKVRLNQFRADHHRDIQKEISDFLYWWNEPPLDLDTLIRTAIAHLWFTSIQPFEDGADEILFHLTDLAFAQDEKCDFRIHDFQVQVLNQQNSYFEVLEKTQATHSDITEWLVWFLKNFSDCCRAQKNLVFQYLQIGNFWQLASMHNLNDRQRKILNYLLSAEKSVEITNRFCVELCGSNREAVKRDLSGLVELGLIQCLGEGRSVRYIM